MHNKLAHTAEHAFVGSLQKILGTTLEVRKVEHREKDSILIIRLSNLDLQTITDAQREVNSLIRVGRKVKTYSFETMESARKHFPNLRANEDRIKRDKVPIRVVEIEGHDVAACAMNHAGDLHECEFFGQHIPDDYQRNRHVRPSEPVVECGDHQHSEECQPHARADDLLDRPGFILGAYVHPAAKHRGIRHPHVHRVDQ